MFNVTLIFLSYLVITATGDTTVFGVENDGPGRISPETA